MKNIFKSKPLSEMSIRNTHISGLVIAVVCAVLLIIKLVSVEKGVRFERDAFFTAAARTSGEANPQIRFINKGYLDSLDSVSKWRTEPLSSLLQDVFNRDLNDFSNSDQAWEFSSSEFKDVRDWCLARTKGSQTNKDFLEEFIHNRKQPVVA